MPKIYHSIAILCQKFIIARIGQNRKICMVILTSGLVPKSKVLKNDLSWSTPSASEKVSTYCETFSVWSN
jgi:hypothetical protein